MGKLQHDAASTKLSCHLNVGFWLEKELSDQETPGKPGNMRGAHAFEIVGWYL